MFYEIDLKIKRLAKIIFVIGILASIIGALGILIEDSDLIVASISTVIGGVIATVISSLFIYAFGELLDKITKIEKYLRKDYESREKSDNNINKQLNKENNDEKNIANDDSNSLNNIENKVNSFLDDFLS